MRWSPRQRALLQAMGLRLWDAAPARPLGANPGAAGATAHAASGIEAAVAPVTAIADPDRARKAGHASDPPREARFAHALDGADPARPDAPAVASMDWPALRDAVASCKACALCESRTHTVFGTGNAHAQWMIVGEAPGAQEDLLGEPFVGKSGQLLDAMLRAIGLTREASTAAQQVYIANTLKCRPPGNRNPLPGELARCEPFLVRQIELVRPRIIVAMGRFAVQALLRSNEPVGRLRGQIHRYHDVPLVVTYHPAYLLRNPLDKARAWDDLRLALGAFEHAGAA